MGPANLAILCQKRPEYTFESNLHFSAGKLHSALGPIWHMWCYVSTQSQSLGTLHWHLKWKFPMEKFTWALFVTTASLSNKQTEKEWLNLHQGFLLQREASIDARSAETKICFTLLCSTFSTPTSAFFKNVFMEFQGCWL